VTLSQRLSRFSEILLDFFFPRYCVGCGSVGDFFCAECLRKLPRIQSFVCPRCGEPQSSGILCSSCWGRQTEIDGIRFPFRFDGIVRQAIHELKYRNLKAICPSLAQLLADYLQLNPLPADILVSVPLHPRRLRERGYNQSSLLAQELSRIIHLPVNDNSLIRVKDAPPQVRTASAEERRRNVDGAFVCRDQKLEGECVLLIDDVCTSGATLEACAHAAKDGGAVSVWGLTIAKEI